MMMTIMTMIMVMNMFRDSTVGEDSQRGEKFKVAASNHSVSNPLNVNLNQPSSFSV